MRLATIRVDGGTRAARVHDDHLTLLAAPDVGALLADPSWPDAIGTGRLPATGTGRLPLESADYAPLVPNPSKILCVGLNYRGHILEMGRDLPSVPTLFAKFAASLVGARDRLVLPAVSDQVDWEAELAVLVGRPIRRATATEASTAIAGYSVLNDVSMRDWQWRTSQWLQGKTFEASTPLGPWLSTPDEVGDAADLEVRCEVDGVMVQRARTSDLLFRPAEVLAYVSRFITLVPGDVVATGTPAGVGAGREPKTFLRPGQVLRTAIEGLGECVNECVREAE
ncbi:fumarylacetoacetate hydrolase family protein [Plantactinospora sp. WMMC1484]|uniref:fumarylacetoacetate hydrolase family protein n=1 Tax=Plantactinospora sp. WMMC1484 TaxID=3404122 RepID=UPI003BF4F77B